VTSLQAPFFFGAAAILAAMAAEVWLLAGRKFARAQPIMNEA
jgi:hypothetical protein